MEQHTLVTGLAKENGALQNLCNDYLFELHVKNPIHLDGKFRELEEKVHKLQQENITLKNAYNTPHIGEFCGVDNYTLEVYNNQIKEVLQELGGDCRQAWQENIDSLKICAKENKETNKLVEGKVVHLETELVAYKVQLDEFKAKNAQLKQNVTCMEQQNTQFREKIEHLVSELSSKSSLAHAQRDMGSDIPSSQTDEWSLVTELRAETSKKTELVESLTSSLEFFTKENEELRSVLLQATTQVNTLTAREEALLVDNNALKKNLEARPTVDMLGAVSRQNVTLNERVTSLIRELEQRDEERVSILSRLATKESELSIMLANEKANLEAESAQQRELSRISALLSASEDNETKNSATIATLEEQCQRAMQQLEQLQRESTTGNSTIEAIKSECDQRLKSLTQEVEELASKCAELTSELECAIVDRDSARQDRDIALDQRDKARRERDHALADRDIARDERDTAVTERDAALTERDQAVSEKNYAINATDAALAERDDVVVKKDTLITERAELLSERDAILAQRDVALAERAAALTARNAAIQERDVANSALEDAVRKLDSVKTFQAEVEVISQARNTLKKELVELKVLYNAKAANEESLGALLVARDGTIQNLTTEISRTEAELSNVKQQFEQQQQRLEVFSKKEQEVKRLLQASTEEVSRAKAERERGTREAQLINEEKVQLKHIIEELTCELSIAKKSCTEGEQEVRARTESEQALQTQLRAVLDQLSALQGELKSKETQINVLATKKTALETKLTESENQLRSRNTEVTNLKTALRESLQTEKEPCDFNRSNPERTAKQASSPKKAIVPDTSIAQNREVPVESDPKSKRQKTSHNFQSTPEPVAKEINRLPEKKYVVSLSGFKKEEQKKSLADIVVRLGGEVRVEAEFDNKITHVVTPEPNTRTMKTLAAALTYRWIISPDWLINSGEAGKFVEEGEFGVRPATKPFDGKKFFFSDEFKKERSVKIENTTNLIDLGKGIMVDKESSADFILVSDANSKVAPNPKAVSFSQFVALIPLTQSSVTSKSNLDLPSSNPPPNTPSPSSDKRGRLSVRFADKNEKSESTTESEEAPKSTPPGKRKSSASTTPVKSKKK